jgi:hypothetical protein
MATDPVDPHGPVFVSYRQSDGTECAVALAWLFRAAGVPVWHDQIDLPPGDTDSRLQEALADGLSGGVLVVTPEIEHSAVVRNIELQQLLDLERDPRFVMTVANTVRGSNGNLDYSAPDKLLQKPPGTVGRIEQRSGDTGEGRLVIVRKVLLHRLRYQARARGGQERSLHLSLQTRGRPSSAEADPADLRIRLRPATAGRLPSSDGLHDLQATLPLLAEAIATRGATSLRITGGAHLSVALAVGSALPATLIGDVSVEGTDGNSWRTATVSAHATGGGSLQLVGHGANPLRSATTRKFVAAYVDLLPDRSDDAYNRFLNERSDFDAWQHLRSAHDGPLAASEAGPLILETASRLRKLSQDNGNAELHLLLRAPFPAAVLIGRLLNTLRVVAYEWTPADDADTDGRPRYVPSLVIATSEASGPIIQVRAAQA